MKICHVCGNQCDDSVETCVKCGAMLNNPQNEEPERETVINNPVLAVSIADPVTAEIFEDVLSDSGILYSVNNENAMHLGFGGGFMAVDVYVDEADLDTALFLYKQLENSDPIFDDESEEEI